MVFYKPWVCWQTSFGGFPHQRDVVFLKPEFAGKPAIELLLYRANQGLYPNLQRSLMSIKLDWGKGELCSQTTGIVWRGISSNRRLEVFSNRSLIGLLANQLWWICPKSSEKFDVNQTRLPLVG